MANRILIVVAADSFNEMSTPLEGWFYSANVKVFRIPWDDDPLVDGEPDDEKVADKLEFVEAQMSNGAYEVVDYFLK